jgi:hypothetical protein
VSEKSRKKMELLLNLTTQASPTRNERRDDCYISQAHGNRPQNAVGALNSAPTKVHSSSFMAIEFAHRQYQAIWRGALSKECPWAVSKPDISVHQKPFAIRPRTTAL